MAMLITTFLRITRLVVNQLTSLWYGASARDFLLYTSTTFMWRLWLIICDVINTCDGTIYNLSAYVCDWSLDAHKIMHPILFLKLGVTILKREAILTGHAWPESSFGYLHDRIHQGGCRIQRPWLDLSRRMATMRHDGLTISNISKYFWYSSSPWHYDRSSYPHLPSLQIRWKGSMAYDDRGWATSVANVPTFIIPINSDDFLEAGENPL